MFVLPQTKWGELSDAARWFWLVKLDVFDVVDDYDNYEEEEDFSSRFHPSILHNSNVTNDAFKWGWWCLEYGRDLVRN